MIEPIVDIEGEVWKDVAGYEGLYMVSNFARVKSINHSYRKGVIKHPMNHPEEVLIKTTKGHYYVVGLRSEGEKKSRTKILHRIVAVAFVENPDNLPEVNHLNGDKSNNTPGNLEWCTRKENIIHAWENGLITVWDRTGRKNDWTPSGADSTSSKKVYQYDLRGVFLQEWFSVTEAAKSFGPETLEASKVRIANAARGGCKSSRGFQWSYKKHETMPDLSTNKNVSGSRWL